MYASRREFILIVVQSFESVVVCVLCRKVLKRKEQGECDKILRPIATAFQRRQRPTGTELVHRPSPLNMRLWLAVLRGVHSGFSPVPPILPKIVVLLAQTNAWSVLEQCLCVDEEEERDEVEKKQELQFISNGLSRLAARPDRYSAL